MDNIDFFSQLSKTLWGNYGFHTMFYLGLILIVILEQEQWKKNTFVWYSVLVLLVIYNPVVLQCSLWVFGYQITEYVFMAYYLRLFSVIPIVFVIAYAMALILNKVSGARKLILTLVVTGIIVLSGHCLYREEWFVKASNYNKVPNDVLQICEMFQESEAERIRIVAPRGLSIYMCQMDSSFLMPYLTYSTYSDNWISGQLMSETPDALAVIQYAVNADLEYIVCNRSNDTLTAFTSLGCEVMGYTDEYAVVYNLSLEY